MKINMRAGEGTMRVRIILGEHAGKTGTYQCRCGFMMIEVRLDDGALVQIRSTEYVSL